MKIRSYLDKDFTETNLNKVSLIYEVGLILSYN